MRTKLKNIAGIQTGISAKSINDGEIVCLQAKHFNENGNLISSLHPDISADGITGKHLLQQGDILFAAKGTKNFATCFQNIIYPSVASTSFFVIRLHVNYKTQIQPEFLVWFINNPVSQKYLKGNAIGTSMVSISKVVLAELEISIPTIKIQEVILKISQLRNIELDIIHRIEINRAIQIQQQIINAIK